MNHKIISDSSNSAQQQSHPISKNGRCPSYILSSDDEFTATIAEINLQAVNLNAYFSILQSRLDAVLHNETADPSLITPTRTTITTGSALIPPLITRGEVEDFKRTELAKLGLDYIPRVLAEFQEGE
ncbi:hypothetical protein [Methanolobus sp. ZRKC5]|uniref:hypothetical protein n=1 Tax=unclassified Methanolobus TaxID=2629569 RepID=UPI00313DB2A3